MSVLDRRFRLFARPAARRAWYGVSLCIPLLAPIHPQGGTLKPDSLRIAFSHTCFIGVNRNSAEASFKAFLATVGRRRGYELSPRVDIFDSNAALENAIQTERLQLVIVDSWHYLQLEPSPYLEPAYVPVPDTTVGRRYALITRRRAGVDWLENLRGKNLIRLEAGSATMGGPWLDTLLLTNGLGSPESFFGSVEVAGKPTGAVLPVFFGNRDVCLVDLPGFEIMKDLNPQVGTALQVLVASDACVDNVVCLTRDGWSSPAFRQDVLQALGELQLEPAGQQILTLFKISKLAPFESSQLDPIRKLRQAREALRPDAPPRPDSPDPVGHAPESVAGTSPPSP